MFQPLIEVAFIVIYAALLGLVFPYVSPGVKNYGALIPAAISLAAGSLVWGILALIGMPDTEAWIWVITMVAMPVAMGFGSKYYSRFREQGKLDFVLKISNAIDGATAADKNADDVVVLSA